MAPAKGVLDNWREDVGSARNLDDQSRVSHGQLLCALHFATRVRLPFFQYNSLEFP